MLSVLPSHPDRIAHQITTQTWFATTQFSWCVQNDLNGGTTGGPSGSLQRERREHARSGRETTNLCGSRGAWSLSMTPDGPTQ